mgnify:FL=1
MYYQTYLDNIEKKLKAYFDIYRDYSINGYEYDLFAKYHLRMERYVIHKKAVIYAMENNEYCLIKHFKSIDEDTLRNYTDSLIESINELVKPDENHMSSTITGVLVLDYKPEDNIIQKIKKFKYHKGFAFGFRGWADIRLILVTMDDNYIVTNKKGKEVKEVYSI